MPHSTLNINSTTKEVFSNYKHENGVAIEEISISNKTGGNIDISIIKYNTILKKEYTILSPTTLGTGRTFFKNGGYLDWKWDLKVTITGGDADVDFNYKVL